MKIIGGIREMEIREQSRSQTANQVELMRMVVAEHPDAVAVEVADERSGQRFGNRKCRLGQCLKLGGARQPLWYQIWATWAEHDLKQATI